MLCHSGFVARAADGAFEVGELDYLKDTNDNGVGDVNERLMGTDPADAESTPGASAGPP